MEILKCPNCNKKLFVDNLASNPMQYSTYCIYCDFSLPFYRRINSFKKITQDELNMAFLTKHLEKKE